VKDDSQAGALPEGKSVSSQCEERLARKEDAKYNSLLLADLVSRLEVLVIHLHNLILGAEGKNGSDRAQSILGYRPGL
jgi:hypothetical protein